jgi:hypothetical protein
MLIKKSGNFRLPDFLIDHDQLIRPGLPRPFAPRSSE